MEKFIAKRAKKVASLILLSSICLSLGGCGRIADMVVSNLQEDSVESNIETESESEEFNLEEESEKDYLAEISEEEVERNEWKDYDVELSENIMDFEIAIDGEVYKFPMWFSDFEEKGWEFKGDKTVSLSSSEYVISMEWEKNGVRATTNITNLSLNTATLENSLITRFVIDSYDLADLKASVEFPCDILVGKSTKEDIIKAYGEPDDTADRVVEEQLCYYGPEYEQSHNFLVNKETGILSSFILENVVEVEGLDNEVSAEVPDDIAAYVPPVTLSDSLYDIAFELDGIVYELPCPTAYFLENGFTVAEEYANEVIPAGRTSYINLRYDNKDINVCVRNTTDKATTPEYCWVIEFKAFSRWTELNLNMVLPEGLVVGMTEEEVMSVLDGNYNYEPLYDGAVDYFVYKDKDTRFDHRIILYFIDEVLKGFEFSTDTE